MSFFLYLILLCWLLRVHAFQTLSDNFLRNISSGGNDFDPENGALLSPILIPRVSGTPGNSVVQRHFIEFFAVKLPKWTFEWQNSSAINPEGTQVSISNLIFKREPPWTKQGEANFLVFAAHYDSNEPVAGYMDASDGAVPCALMMHTANSIDRYMTQMHDEMVALGEGGTEAMDMGVQIVFLDGSRLFPKGTEPSLFGAKALSKSWEERHNPVGKSPNALSQVRLLVLLDTLGHAKSNVPSYLRTTTWAHAKMADVEARMRGLGLLETILPASPLLEPNQADFDRIDRNSDHTPFMERGVPFLHLLPGVVAQQENTMQYYTEPLHLPTVRDWARVMAGFALEWLDMMEVWPQ